MDGLEQLQAVRDAPGDDGRLLAYAAWLAGQGDPLGEFIRVQALVAPGLAVAERAELVAREAGATAWWSTRTSGRDKTSCRQEPRTWCDHASYDALRPAWARPAAASSASSSVRTSESVLCNTSSSRARESSAPACTDAIAS